MDQIFTLLLLGAAAIGMAIGGFFLLMALTFLIYVVSHLYPWLRNIALWCARPANFFSLLILAVILLVIVLFAVIFLRQTLLLMLIVLPLLLLIPIGIAIFVWVIKLVIWLYVHWRAWLVGLYISARVEFIKLKIKMDMQKDADWKAKWSDWKGKLSSNVEQTRSRITRRK